MSNETMSDTNRAQEFKPSDTPDRHYRQGRRHAFWTMIGAAALIAAMAAIIASIALLIIALFWHPGCCCCCGQGRQAVASVEAVPPGSTPIAPDARPIAGLRAQRRYPMAMRKIVLPPSKAYASIELPQVLDYTPAGEATPIQLPVGIPDFGPPTGYTPIGPLPEVPRGHGMPVAEPAAWPLFAAAVVAIGMAGKMRGRA